LRSITGACGIGLVKWNKTYISFGERRIIMEVKINKVEFDMIELMLDKCADWMYDYWNHEEADKLYDKFKRFEESE
jgi:hypothetical protein